MSSYKQLSNQGTLLLGAGASKSSDKRRPISTVISTGHSHRCSPLPNQGQQWAEQQAPISCYCFVCKQSLNFVTPRRAPAGVSAACTLLLRSYTVAFCLHVTLKANANDIKGKTWKQKLCTNMAQVSDVQLSGLKCQTERRVTDWRSSNGQQCPR